MKSLNIGRRSRRPLRRSVAGGAALALVITLLGALFNSASATHPTVVGKTVCDTATGTWSIVWTVGGDTSYPNATATIKSQSLATDPTLVGKAVKDTQTVSGTQTGTVAASTTFTQTVEVQFDTHTPGSLVTQSGSVTTGADCKKSVPVPAKPGMNDPCGPNNATWIKPTDTASVAWVLEVDGDLVAMAKPGFVFDNGQSEINFGKVVDSNAPCPVVTPPVVTPPVVTPPATPNKGMIVGSCVTPTRGEGVAKGRVTNAHSTRVTVKQNSKVVKTRVVSAGARFRMELSRLTVGSTVKLFMGGKLVDRDFVEDNCLPNKTPHVGLPRVASKALSVA